MKKSFFIHIILLINLIIIPYTSFGGILSDPMGFDMYKKIDKGLYDLEVKYVEREMKGDSVDITSDLNKRAKANNLRENCFKEGLTVDTIKKIVNDFDLSDMISEDCLSKENPISSKEYNEYAQIVKESYEENLKKAQNKVKKTYEIGRIGMYSDGLEENSPFDLMIDIDEIDKIIFEQDIPYNGVNTENLGNVIDGILNGLSSKQAFGLNKYNDNIIFKGKYKDTTDNSSVKQFNDGNNQVFNDGNNQVCKINNSGLNQNSLNKILGELNKNNPGSLNGNTSGTGNSNSGSLNGNNPGSLNGNTSGTGNSNSGSLNGNKNSGGGEYSKVNDNSIWPCNEFFCIVIKFVTYQHNLLGGGKNLSIEGLIKRSNAHLKKFASTSLIQSNMTINNFELGLKNLNLPDIFHVGTQVSYKPVPIINVEKDGKDKTSDEFKYKNLLTRYYKNLGLDYERANDLKIFNQIEPEIKSILEGTEMPQTEAEKKENSFSNYLDTIKKENEYISNTIIDKKIITEDMDNFYKQFAELESFTNALLDYTIGIGGIIKKMDEIPKK